MNLLLDTHAVIWFITEDRSLPYNLKRLIESSSNQCFVSIASYWEMGIKHSLGKLELKTGLQTIFQVIEMSGLKTLPITPNHILAASILEFHHRDPFDRLIIGQALSDRLTLVSKDKEFEKYTVPLIWSSK